MFKLLLLLVFSFGVLAKEPTKEDVYILPEEIKEQLAKVLESKRKLDEYIITRYTELCMKENNEAEFFERLAYQEILGFDCSFLFGKFIYLP